MGQRIWRDFFPSKASRELTLKYWVDVQQGQSYLMGRCLFSLDVICDITIYANDTTLYSKCDQSSDLWQQLELASEDTDTEDTDIYETLWTRVGGGLLISMLQKLNWFHLTGLITLVLLM